VEADLTKIRSNRGVAKYEKPKYELILYDFWIPLKIP